MLGDLLGGTNESYANAMSPIGDVVVGQASSGKGLEAFRWTAIGGMRALGLPAGYQTSRPLGVSADGTVVVGEMLGNGSSVTEAFIWTLAAGTRRLTDHLTDMGVDLAGNKLETATGIAWDGKTIVGYGSVGADQRAFVVRLP